MMPASSVGGHTGQASSSDCSAMKAYSWSSKQPDHLLPSCIPWGSVASFPREQSPKQPVLQWFHTLSNLPPQTRIPHLCRPILSRAQSSERLPSGRLHPLPGSCSMRLLPKAGVGFTLCSTLGICGPLNSAIGHNTTHCGTE